MFMHSHLVGLLGTGDRLIARPVVTEVKTDTEINWRVSLVQVGCTLTMSVLSFRCVILKYERMDGP
jgi:hypothetical protein